VALLGADTPLEEVAIAARRSRCDAVVVSMSVDPSPGIIEKRLRALVRDAGVPVFVGGGAGSRNKSAIAAAGAVALAGEMEHAVRLIAASLERKRSQ
jgi:cobalamin-dependent methionine synthase I